jgi:hypothetical protein
MDTETTLVHLARLAVEGRANDVQALVRRALLPIVRNRSDLADQAKSILSAIEQKGLTRANLNQPIPVDSDSRLELLRREAFIEFDTQPVWTPNVLEEINATVEERNRSGELLEVGLSPTRLRNASKPESTL